MPKPFDFGGVNLSVGGDSEGARPSSEIPFCIVVLGDFSGRSHRGISDAKTIGKRRATLVDRDNFDEVLARFSAEIQLPLGEGESKLRFSDLDDFHPDQVFNHLDAFGKLREVRARLQDPSTFETTARELGIRSQDPEPADSRPSSTSPRGRSQCCEVGVGQPARRNGGADGIADFRQSAASASPR